MDRRLRLLLFVILSVGAVFAQQAPNDEPATNDDIEKLFTTMHIREQTRNMMSVMSKQSKQMAHDAL